MKTFLTVLCLVAPLTLSAQSTLDRNNQKREAQSEAKRQVREGELVTQTEGAYNAQAGKSSRLVDAQTANRQATILGTDEYTDFFKADGTKSTDATGDDSYLASRVKTPAEIKASVRLQQQGTGARLTQSTAKQATQGKEVLGITPERRAELKAEVAAAKQRLTTAGTEDADSHWASTITTKNGELGLSGSNRQSADVLGNGKAGLQTTDALSKQLADLDQDKDRKAYANAWTNDAAASSYVARVKRDPSLAALLDIVYPKPDPRQPWWDAVRRSQYITFTVPQGMFAHATALRGGKDAAGKPYLDPEIFGDFTILEGKVARFWVPLQYYVHGNSIKSKPATADIPAGFNVRANNNVTMLWEVFPNSSNGSTIRVRWNPSWNRSGNARTGFLWTDRNYDWVINLVGAYKNRANAIFNGRVTQAEIDRLNAELAEMELQLTQLQNEIYALERGDADFKATVEQFKATEKLLLSQIESLRQGMQSADTGTIEQELALAKRELESANSLLSRAQLELTNFLSTSSDVSAEASLRQRVTLATDEVTDAKAKVSLLESQLQQAADSAALDKTATEAKIAMLEKRLAELRKLDLSDPATALELKRSENTILAAKVKAQTKLVARKTFQLRALDVPTDLKTEAAEFMAKNPDTTVNGVSFSNATAAYGYSSTDGEVISSQTSGIVTAPVVGGSGKTTNQDPSRN